MPRMKWTSSELMKKRAHEAQDSAAARDLILDQLWWYLVRIERGDLARIIHIAKLAGTQADILATSLDSECRVSERMEEWEHGTKQ